MPRIEATFFLFISFLRTVRFHLVLFSPIAKSVTSNMFMNQCHIDAVAGIVRHKPAPDFAAVFMG
jgi:hypothetical protein